MSQAGGFGKKLINYNNPANPTIPAAGPPASPDPALAGRPFGEGDSSPPQLTDAHNPPTQAGLQGAGGDAAETGAGKSQEKRDKAIADQNKARALAEKEAEKAKARLLANFRQGATSAGHDSNLVNDAFKSIKTGKPFSEKDAVKAEDDYIRERLLRVAAAQEVRQDLKKEELRLTDQIAQLSSMAATMMANSKGLKSVPIAAGKDSNGPITGTDQSQSKISAAGEKAELDSKVAQSEAEIAAKKEAADMLAKAKAKAALQKYSALKSSLKEKLVGTDAPTPGTENSNSSTGSSNMGGGVKPSSPANRVAAELLDSPVAQIQNTNNFGGVNFGGNSGGSGKHFSLTGSETEAEVKKMIEQADRALASNETGILNSDSVSLFDRVRATHLNCLKHNCVTRR